MFSKKTLSVLMLTALTSGALAIAVPATSYAKGVSGSHAKGVAHKRKARKQRKSVKVKPASAAEPSAVFAPAGM